MPNQQPAPPLPPVSSGTVTRGANGELIWTRDPRETYADPPVPWSENSVSRIATAKEWATLNPPDAPAPRVLIRKSTVQARAAGAGKLDAIFKVLNSSSILFAQWFAPDWPNVYADDPGLLQVLKGVGCTNDQIATITAPDPSGPA